MLLETSLVETTVQVYWLRSCHSVPYEEEHPNAVQVIKKSLLGYIFRTDLRTWQKGYLVVLTAFTACGFSTFRPHRFLRLNSIKRAPLPTV